MVGRVILEGQPGFVMLLLAVFGAAAVVWFVGTVLSECCTWVWRRLRRGGRRQGCRGGRSWSLPEVEDCPPMPPVKAPRGKVVRIEVDGRVTDYESAPSEIYAAIAAMVIQNTEILRDERSQPLVATPSGPMPEMEPGDVIEGPGDMAMWRDGPDLFDRNCKYIESLIAMVGDDFTTKDAKGGKERSE